MKTSFLKTISALALAMLTAVAAVATPIQGEINFNSGGFITTDTGNLGTATAISAFPTVKVSDDPTGVYAGTAGNVVAFTPFSFAAGSVTPLWSFTVGLVTYSFDATSIIVNTQNANFLNLIGSGVAHVTGYTDTVGKWSLTSTTQGSKFTFGASTSVPEGGLTAAMLGLGLLGLGLAARRQKRA
jgi:hypothetical protein